MGTLPHVAHLAGYRQRSKNMAYTESHYAIVHISRFSDEFVIKIRNNVKGFCLIRHKVEWNLTIKVTHETG